MSSNVLRQLADLDCTLDESARGERAQRLSDLAAQATEIVAGEERRLVFAPDPEVAAEIGRLAALETQCCAVEFTISVTRNEVTLAIKR